MKIFAKLCFLAQALASETCELTAEAIERGYPKTADVNYVCYPHRCPRRENIMQLYNGLLEENQTLAGELIDCRDRNCAHYMRRRFEMCFPCCNAPLSVSQSVAVANCNQILTFDRACYHYRRHGMVKP